MSIGAGQLRQLAATIIGSNPTVNDDALAGYIVGSVVWSISGTAYYYCTDNTNGAAVWTLVPTGTPITPAALTRTDDTNVTLTLGGSPSTALLQAASMTLGWSGQLSLARGGTNKNMTAAAGAVAYSDADSLELTAVGTTGQVLTSAGTGAPTWATPVAQDSFILTANQNIVTIAAGATIYFTVFGTNANNLITVENQRQTASNIAFTMSRFYVTTLTAQPGTGSLVLTMRKAGVSQALTITIAAGSAAGVFSDTSNSFSVAAGDLLTLQVVNNASSASAQLVGWTALGTR